MRSRSWGGMQRVLRIMQTWLAMFYIHLLGVHRPDAGRRHAMAFARRRRLTGRTAGLNRPAGPFLSTSAD
ncbi:Uncharacterised protein [Brevundimonas vancanneytii]|uniref:Uncharacterized protein n=1 Tax=Brevundimonas vancanneytii TaxID=1325724 RepID=A0A4P1KHP0_9CAUL|nr:Uncharacterised protein [Brevundimonas vancanneytii]